MKKLLLFLLLPATFGNIKAAYFEKLPYTITQPDGKEIICFITGDEFYSRIHDIRDFTIIQAPDGYYYYAVQDGNIVGPSAYIAGSVDPRAAGLKRGARISSGEYRKRYELMNNVRATRKSGSSGSLHTGVLNNIVIYIRFADDPEFTQPRQFFHDIFNPSTGYSLNSYFKEVSYNKLEINSVHYPVCNLNINISYQDYRKRAFFEPFNETTNPGGYKNYDERTLREHSLLADAVSWIDTNSPVSKELNLDADNDGTVDNVCFIIKGGRGTWNELLWAHRWALFTKEASINGKRVYGYIFQPEEQISVRTLCHEMFHAFGAPDLYHYTDQGVINPVGCWDIMETGSGHMTAYMKWKYSGKTWITDIPEIQATGTYRLNPLTSPEDNCYKIRSPFAGDVFFVIEYRKKSGIFENDLPGSGLIVSRIDPSKQGNSYGPPDEIYIYRPGGTSTINGEHLEAWFSESSGRTTISDNTNPSSFLHDGKPGGLFISGIREEDGMIMFNVIISASYPEPGIADTRESLITSLKQAGELKFSIYPNPASATVNLSLGDNREPVSVEIRDIRGALVHSEQPGSGMTEKIITIDISDKAPGMYLVEVRSRKTRRIVSLIKL